MLNFRCPGKSCRLTGGLSFILILLFVFICTAQTDTNTPEKSDTAVSLENKVIDSIDAQGNVFISEEKILSMTRSRAGQIFNTAQAQEDVSRIATIKGIELAYYSTELVGEKVKLIFVVKERSVIRQVSFTGNKKFDSKVLTEHLGLARGDYLDKFAAGAGAEKLTEYYKKKGYPFVKVSFDDSGLSQGRLRYIIEEGTLVKIRKTRFKGNASIKNRELKKAIKSNPKSFGIFQNHFKQSTLDDDLVKLQQAYDSRGYLDTKVDAETNFTKNKKGAEITFAIEEGKQYDVAKIEISGNEFISDANLTADFRLKEGQFYSDEKSDYDRDEILKQYRQIGFIDVQVKSSRQFTADNKINARFDIEEGSRFKIGRINISGNKATQDKVIRRVLDYSDFKPGQWYNAHIAKGDGEGNLEKDIKSGVYAETASITPVGEVSGQKDAEVRITEGKTGSILFGAGVSSTDGLIGQMIYEQRNFDAKKWPKNWRKFFSEDAFKGAGQRLRIAAEPGTQVSRYSISFTEPYLKDKPIAMTISGSNWERGMESYDEVRQKGYLGFTKRKKDGKYRTLSFRFENVSIERLDTDAPKEIVDVKGGNLLAGIRIGFGRDTTDNRFMPTKGKNYEFGYEQVGGDHTFGIIDGTHRWYKTIREDIARRKTVLETKLYAGVIVGNAPPFEKFYGGGLGSIRGFEYRGVSPRSGADKDPVGSDWIVTASSEVVMPLTKETLSGLFFVDTGMVETGGVRASAGIGIQIMIPQWFGPVPMRFELAHPFMKDGDDDTQIFSFSAGALF